LPPPVPVVGFEAEPPHPTMTRTKTAKVKEQRKKRRGRNIHYSRYADVRCGISSFFCLKLTAIFCLPRILPRFLILSGSPAVIRGKDAR